MEGELHLGSFAPALRSRGHGLVHASERWGTLAYGAALAFVANLYASPAHYWPAMEQARLGVVTSAVCAFAVLMRRVTSGERLRLGGPPVAFLFAYAAFVPLSFAWTISSEHTMDQLVDMAKLLVLYVALVNALDSPRRLRTWLLVGGLATLAPSEGGIQRWLQNDNLVEGFRTAWRGNYADPNRLAMGLVLFLPALLVAVGQARRPWLKALLIVAAVSNVAAIVLTHSRSGAVALAVALALTFLRGHRRGRGIVLVVVAAAALAAFAPKSFWQRSETLTSAETYEEDASITGRERAWQMLMVIVSERPLTGVGAGAFIDAWDRFAPLSAGGEHLIAHNIFMETLGELGVIALALFGLWCAWLLWKLWGAAGEGPGGPEARALFAGLAGYIICELANGYARAFNLYAGFAAAMVAIYCAQARKQLAEGAAQG